MEILALKEWFQREKRNLPWRIEPTPYKVWISEVMLQQTQVSVVIPYFMRWMERFPTVEALAKSQLQEVLKAWEGLGYYSRARSLHVAAQYLLSHCDGQLPSSLEELEKIEGLGPYTCGAILSFAFHRKAAAVDGNVVRVLSRYFLIEEVISKSSVQQKLRSLTLSLLPESQPWIIMEALIELGAQICQKDPKCSLCPLQDSCQGFLTGKAELLPKKGKKIEYLVLVRKVVVVTDGHELLLRKEKDKKVMKDLYEFPYFDEQRNIKEEIENQWGLYVETEEPLSKVKHSFTRYRVTLLPTLWKIKQKQLIEGFEWKSWKEIQDLPFSSGHKQVLVNIYKKIQRDFR